MRYPILRTFLFLLVFSMLYGCNAYQPTKNVWKSTKGLWNTYVSPPASVDYEDKGDLPPAAKALSSALMGIDMELGKLERVMQNADRPPTREWLSNLFSTFPWLNGFAGVKYDGTILGQEPPDSMKQLDFIPLLYEDKKQNSRALRCDVQPSPLGPEVMLAAPLYDGMDFLGIVVAYFDMRSLMRFSNNANDIVALTPGALLWAGKYEYAATPLAGVDWAKAARESTAGTCSNSTGSFFYMVRYLGNLPLVFAIPSKGTFPEGNGDLAQAAAYFPQEREKMPPPPAPERKPGSEKSIPAFEKPEPEPQPEPPTPQQPQAAEASERNVIPAGSRDSVLLKGGKANTRRRVQERSLEGENIEVIRAPERRQRIEQRMESEPVELPEPQGPTLPGGRPSPFGPKEEPAPAYQRPSPFGPREPASQPDGAVRQEEQPAQSSAPQAAPADAGDRSEPLADGEVRDAPTEPPLKAAPEPGVQKQPVQPPSGESGAQPEATDDKQETLPGGRPSPFGPRK